jgi:anti-sigma regulatory factor (Ser/Thr protein kinase)
MASPPQLPRRHDGAPPDWWLPFMAEFPRWRAWLGARRFWARLPGTMRVHNADNPADLAGLIRAASNGHQYASLPADDSASASMAPAAAADASLLIRPSHHGHRLERWPLQSAITVEVAEVAVPSARAHVGQLLREWDCTEICQDVSVVISELVTNAVLASAGLRPKAPPLVVWLGTDTSYVLAGVADASPRPPMRLNLGIDAEGGRGLELVEAFSSRWGWHPLATADLRKMVWAEWRLPSRPGEGASSARRASADAV